MGLPATAHLKACTHTHTLTVLSLAILMVLAVITTLKGAMH